MKDAGNRSNWVNTDLRRSRRKLTSRPADPAQIDSRARECATLDQASEILQSVQREEQIDLNQRVREQEWAAQSTQILDFLPELERAVVRDGEGRTRLIPDGGPGFRRILQARHGRTSTPSTGISQFSLPIRRPGRATEAIRAGLESWIMQCAAARNRGETRRSRCRMRPARPQ